MEKTLLNIKTDKKLKKEAQMAARELGLPLGTIVNAYLKEFIREKRIIFSVPPVPNKRTQKLLTEIAKDIRNDKKVDGLFTYEEAVQHLDHL